MKTWEKLYNEALNTQYPQTISSFVEAGQVSCALLTKKGNIYKGVCIDTASSLGMCAERNAIANMITHGESQIERLVAIMPNGNLGTPCGACRELIMQLDTINKEMEILLNIETLETIKLKELLPLWWGESRHQEFNNEVIQRVIEMEKHFDELKKNPSINHPSYKILIDYYENGQWMFDYQQDEQDKLPKDLKRGILSEDGLYNLISDIDN